MMEEEVKKSLNFIEQIIQDDLEHGLKHAARSIIAFIIPFGSHTWRAKPANPTVS